MHGMSVKMWPNLSRKIFLNEVYHVKELIVRYRKMFKLLELDLPKCRYD